MDTIGCVPCRARITNSALENCNSKLKSEEIIDPRTASWAKCSVAQACGKWCEGGIWIPQSTQHCHKDKKASKGCSKILRVLRVFGFSCHKLSFGRQTDEKPDGCTRVWFQQVTAASVMASPAFHPYTWFCGRPYPRETQTPPFPFWIAARSGTTPLAGKGIQSPLIARKKTPRGKPKGSTRMLQALGQSRQHRGALRTQDTEENKQQLRRV